MSLRRILLSLTAVAGLTACVEPTPARELTQREATILDVLLDAGTPAGIAELIAYECPRYGFNTAVEQREIDATARALMDAGYSKDEVDFTVRYGLDAPATHARLQKHLIAWLEKRDVVVTVPATVCAAGDAEIAAGSDIAQYLVKRGGS